jgi:hypothetical protein
MLLDTWWCIMIGLTYSYVFMMLHLLNHEGTRSHLVCEGVCHPAAKEQCSKQYG